MILAINALVLSALGSTVNAAAVPFMVRDSNSTLTSLPQYDSNPAARAAAVAVRKAGYLYGPSLIGNASFFPTGALGDAHVQSDLAAFLVDQNAQVDLENEDLGPVETVVIEAGGLASLDTYASLLYNGEWLNSVPGGEDSGILTNYTQDLQFSMERLSLNPYPLQRVKRNDTLPFTLPPTIAIQIAGLPVEALQAQGRLFVADHIYQNKYPKTAKYGAACTALFYIDVRSGDFLPLAIRTNFGSNLIYTPLDTFNDWLLAKIMFNENDLFHAAVFHLVASHDVGEIVYEAALRTLSANHPIMALLDRLMYEAFAIRPFGTTNLFNPGGNFDTAFYTSAAGAEQYISDVYPTAGDYQANYLNTDFAARGLINCSWGPAFKTFPFYEDTSFIQATIRAFMDTFIEAYYGHDHVMEDDTELQAWFLEASTAAEVINFPCAPSSDEHCNRDTLIDLLTHFAHLTGVVHHALNTGDLVSSIGTLPFHPAALYAPIPATKNVTDLLPYLPPFSAAIFQIDLHAAFNRPLFAAQYKTLAWAYSDPTFLSRFKPSIADAAEKYQKALFELGASIKARTFGPDGLWNGQPFIWRGVDPTVIPWFFAI